MIPACSSTIRNDEKNKLLNCDVEITYALSLRELKQGYCFSTIPNVFFCFLKTSNEKPKRNNIKYAKTF